MIADRVSKFKETNMFDPDMPEPQAIDSLKGFVDETEKAIKSAKALGYMGVSIGLSLETE